MELELTEKEYDKMYPKKKIDKSDYGKYPCVSCGKIALRFKNNPCHKCKRKIINKGEK